MSSREQRIAVGFCAGAIFLLAGALHRGYGRRLWHPYYRQVTEPRTVQTVLAETGPRHRPELRRAAASRGIAYPPPALTLVGYKRENVLEIWAHAPAGWIVYRSYPVLAASGGPGPKLREGVDYPNAFDLARGKEDGRSALGGDIYIHGKAVSIGCLAIGDDNIEELFTLVADTGLPHARIVLAPGRSLDLPRGAPPWTRDLYHTITRELAVLR